MKHNDMLEYLLKEEIMILCSGFEIVSTTSMMAIKYLHDHPSTLQEIRASNSLCCPKTDHCQNPEESITPFQYNSYSIRQEILSPRISVLLSQCTLNFTKHTESSSTQVYMLMKMGQRGTKN